MTRHFSLILFAATVGLGTAAATGSLPWLVAALVWGGVVGLAALMDHAAACRAADARPPR